MTRVFERGLEYSTQTAQKMDKFRERDGRFVNWRSHRCPSSLRPENAGMIRAKQSQRMTSHLERLLSVARGIKAIRRRNREKVAGQLMGGLPKNPPVAPSAPGYSPLTLLPNPSSRWLCSNQPRGYIMSDAERVYVSKFSEQSCRIDLLYCIYRTCAGDPLPQFNIEGGERRYHEGDDFDKIAY